jgi:hypothetical protein
VPLETQTDKWEYHYLTKPGFEVRQPTTPSATGDRLRVLESTLDEFDEFRIVAAGYPDHLMSIRKGREARKSDGLVVISHGYYLHTIPGCFNSTTPREDFAGPDDPLPESSLPVPEPVKHGLYPIESTQTDSGNRKSTPPVLTALDDYEGSVPGRLPRPDEAGTQDDKRSAPAKQVGIGGPALS